MLQSRKERLLHEINARLPPGVDWKEGARRYLSALVRDQGAHNEGYHLIKPFIGGDDFSSFLEEMYRFLNLMSLSPLTGQSRVLDVGCGPGWISHYLGKLGIRVVGIDISQELLDIAARRLATDPFPAMGEFRVKFLLHDIESDPLEGEDPFDLAIFESVLHHFYDPVSVLEHVGRVMKDDGLIAIAEGEAPEPGSETDAGYHFLMNKYHTLERPYSRRQLCEMLDITGFAHYQFFEEVNGWQPMTASSAEKVAGRIRKGSGRNFVVASRSESRMKALLGETRAFPAEQPTVDDSRQRPGPIAPSHVADFLALPHEEFIAEAYRLILGRECDPGGAEHYGRALLRGSLTRIEVLGRLAYSAEGRRAKRRLPGLAPAFVLACGYRVPVLGPLAGLTARLLGLPAHWRDRSDLEAVVVASRKSGG